MDISDVPPGTVMDRYPEEGCESGNPVLGCSLQYSMDLTVYIAILEDPEQMLSRIGCEVRAGAPRNAAGRMIVIPDDDETCPDCLGSYAEDVPYS